MIAVGADLNHLWHVKMSAGNVEGSSDIQVMFNAVDIDEGKPYYGIERKSNGEKENVYYCLGVQLQMEKVLKPSGFIMEEETERLVWTECSEEYRKENNERGIKTQIDFKVVSN